MVTAGSSISLSSLTSSLAAIAISPPVLSQCVIVTSGNSGAGAFIIPYLVNGRLSAPLVLAGTKSAGPGTSIPGPISIAPNGQWFAIGYITENVVRIFTLNSDYTATFITNIDRVYISRSSAVYTRQWMSSCN